MNQSTTKAEGWSTANWFMLPSDCFAGLPKAALRFLALLVISDVVCGFVLLFLLYINIEIGKK